MSDLIFSLNVPAPTKTTRTIGHYRRRIADGNTPCSDVCCYHYSAGIARPERHLKPKRYKKLMVAEEREKKIDPQRC